MAEAGFYDAPPREQIRRLAELTRAALPEWGLGGASVETVAYRENMTFRVDAGAKGSYAFRVHQANYRTDAQIQSELDLMTYLNEEGIQTPRVVPTEGGALFATVNGDGVPEPRQCDVFEWIEGKQLRTTGEPLTMPINELTVAYENVGELAARMHNLTERWARPSGFDRPAWDAEGIFGPDGHLGDFRKLQGVTDEQQKLMEAVAEKLTEMLNGFGKTPDRWGLSHGDFLAENIIVGSDGIRLVDFDDAGESWFLFELGTALFDLLDTEAFAPCLGAIVTGYRRERDLPDAHLAMLPAFFMARVLSYLGWCAKKPHMAQSEWMKPLLLAAIEEHGRGFAGG